MANLEDDINFFNNRRNGINRFVRLYSRTNEDLQLLFNNIDVKDLNILTVLSSSDYLFSQIYMGAKTIDSFDINSLTYRYYFLRKWLISKGYVDAWKLEEKDLLLIINDIVPKTRDEADSVIFWNYFFKIISRDKLNLYLEDDLFIDICPRTMIYEEDLSKLDESLDNYILNFKKINICDEIKKNKKYDMIFLSNILDYNRDNLYTLKEISYRLHALLNKDGRLILSHFGMFVGMEAEKQIFMENFEYENISSTNAPIFFYQYKKKNDLLVKSKKLFI